MEERLTYNADEAARLLGMSKPTLYQALKRRDIPSLRIGRKILIPKGALQKWLDASGVIQS